MKSSFTHLQDIERNAPKRNIQETLQDSNFALWYLSKDSEAIYTISTVFCNASAKILEEQDVKPNRYSCLKSETIEVFKEYVSRNELPSIVIYLKYEADKEYATVKHQEADSIFCTALLYLKDTTTNWLHVDDVDLPEFFYPGDVFMDPRQEHGCTKCIRNELRQVFVLTI